MLKKILIGLAALVVSAIAVLVGLAAMQPDSFHIERSATIEAPPEAIYAILADFRRSTEWSPFEKTDPDMKRAFSGADKGKGAVYTWDGNSEAGAGRIEIVEASAPSKLVLTLDFERPMEGHNIVEYTLAPDGDATNVTWAIHGPLPFISKVMCLFVDMDEMIGGKFEEGLSNLKKVAETTVSQR